MKRRDFNKMLFASGAALPVTGAMSGLFQDGAAYAQDGSGGLVSIIQPEPPTLILALNQQSPTGVVATKIFEGLLSYDIDLNAVPQLAESWEISEDGLTYTFNLVKNAKWHDGEPFTAKDVVFSCSDILMEVHPRARAAFGRCSSIEATDDYTVVFTLSEPFAPFILSFEATSAPIVPAHLYEGTDYRDNPANDTPIGTGPFKYNEWMRGSYIHLVANEDYYLEGQPGLTEIYFQVIPDGASRSVAMETGEAQLASWGDIETFDVERLAALPNLTLTTSGYEFYSPVMWYELNLRKPPLNDKRFRKAMMHLIDKNFIVERIMFNLAKPATGPIASTTKFFEPDLPTYDFDVDKANQILDEMGMEKDGDGNRVTLNFTIAPYGESWQRMAEYFRQAMAAGGININLVSTDVAGWGQAVADWDFDCTTNMLYQFGDPALGVARTYISSNIRQGVLFSNTEGYSNPEVDELFAQAAVSTSDEERQELYTKVQQILVDELPVLWTTEQQYPTLYDSRLSDLIVTATGVNGTFGPAHYA